MTVYIVPHAPWHECVSEYLHYALDPDDSVQLVAPREVTAAMALPDRVLAAPHLLGPQGAGLALPPGARCYESENLFAGSAAAQANAALRIARPDLRWEHYSPYQASVYEETAKPPRLPPLRARTAPPPGAPILFVGSINERRARVLGQLPQDRLRIVGTKNPVWGAALRAELDRAAFVINLRYYDRPSDGARVGLPETFRICFALDAGCPALSEMGLDEPGSHEQLWQCAYGALCWRARGLLDEHDRQGGVR